MAGNKAPLIQLQRRGGRRISVPSSPVVERHATDGSGQTTTPSPPEDPSSTPLDSPCIDVNMPSPTFDIPGVAIYPERQHDPNRGMQGDYSGGKFVITDDTARSPQLASPASDGGYKSSQRPQQPESGLRSSPLSGTQRDGHNGVKWIDMRSKTYERPGGATRNTIYPSAATDRSLFEEASNRTGTAKKSRLNLLNPMSLLARRRSSQHTKLDDVNVNPLHVPAIPDFDPSIRGNIVHDFSAPRLRTPRRDPITNPVEKGSSNKAPPQTIPVLSPSIHSPVFKEHFQDDESVLQPSHTAYLHNQSLKAPSSESLPPFAQNLPTRLPIRQTSVDSNVSPDINEPEPALANSSPNAVTSSINDLPLNAHLPKHMKSTSSRFSFQTSGQGSAQEKLLEERHRERFPDDIAVNNDHFDDDYDNYDFEADDDFEEKIPGVNAGVDDYEDDEFGVSDIPVRDIDVPTSSANWNEEDQQFEGDDVIPLKDINIPTIQQQHASIEGSGSTARHSLYKFHFTPQSVTISPSPTSTQHQSEPTPRDSEGFPIGIADTTYSPTCDQLNREGLGQTNDSTQPLFLNGLRISTNDEFEQQQFLSKSGGAFDDADLYFDDGEFDSEHIESNIGFDEDLLDDENVIRDIPAENTRRYETALSKSLPGAKVTTVDTGLSRDTSTSSDFVNVENDQVQLSTMSPPKSSASAHGVGVGLTETNLAAYHDALALAANNAANSGRFNRSVSFSENSNAAEDHPWSSPSGLVTDEGTRSFHLSHGGAGEYDVFAFEDDGEFDDDLMIAEANAEALENDDEGFYGQEFGFYARAHGKEPLDFVNGGYFTSRGSNGLKRSHSGKANFQEPSLTPITERSEWSARNSVVSLQFPNGFSNTAQSLPSPGLNQLMDSPAIEDEMSLSALLKLRRGAFGGSSTSVNSLGDRSVPTSSPLAHVSSYKFPQNDAANNRMNTANSGANGSTSILESEEEDDDYGGRATITQNTPQKPKPTEEFSHTPEHSIHTKLDVPVTMKKGHHSRNSSGAESVSYARDDDGRWILERRRTGDDGELELIGREYLAGARI